MTVNTNSPAGAMPATDGGDFFRYHGVWAPGVRLFRNVKFRTKAWIISAAFMVPLATVGWNWFSAQSAAIDFSAKERIGVEYAQEVMPILESALHARVRVAEGGAPGATADLKPQLDRLAKAQDKLGADLGTATAYKAALAAQQAAAGAGGPDAVKVHNEFVTALVALVTAAADGSNLTLDPDIDTYYLMDASYTAVPSLAESVGRLEALSYLRKASGGKLNVSQQLAAAEALGDDYHNRLLTGLAKVLAVRPELARKLDDKPGTEPMHKMHELLGSEQADPAEVARLGEQSLAAFFVLQKATAGELDRLLDERIGGLEAKRNVVAVVIALFLAIGAYLFASFAIVMGGGMDYMSAHIDRIAAGDLSAKPNAWGRDEIGVVLNRLSDMRSGLSRTIGTIRSSADQVAIASTQLSEGTNDLARRTEETAANLEKSASAMEQMQSAVRNTADTTREVAQLAKENADVASRGGMVITQAVATMQDIQSSSSKVADIIGVIDGIAFQTNILALNAAVEAARAGEQGKGFAVVAGEVRSLAQRSAEAAREIKTLIDSAVVKTESGSQVVQQAGETMQQIVDSVQRINTLLTEVASATSEQTTGIAHVNETVSEIDRNTQQNAALVEEASAAAQSMHQQAQALATVASRFKLA